jgi:tetratricopeptide (TPR) repeat protein
MSPRARVYAVVVAACIAAGGAAAGVVLATGGEKGEGPHGTKLAGNPPLELDLGVRQDREAVALRKAQRLYLDGKRGQAAAIFERYRSLQARVGASMAGPSRLRIEGLRAEARRFPSSSVIRLNLGLALLWDGEQKAALAAWREAKRVEPDSSSAVRADDFLHPGFNRGLPTFVPSFGPPPGLARRRPDRQLAILARAARRQDVRAKLLYGIALQRLGRPLSAERVFGQAAVIAPGDPDAQVAAAVGRFDKEHPERAFSRLGPLTRRFPHATTVRFHLGLLLLWMGQVSPGKRQLRLARAEDPGSPLGREAALFLRRLENVTNK